jgi:hypothetical protein
MMSSRIWNHALNLFGILHIQRTLCSRSGMGHAIGLVAMAQTELRPLFGPHDLYLVFA